MKRKYWIQKGLIRSIRLQKILWIEHNVLTQKTLKIKKKQTFKNKQNHDNFGRAGTAIRKYWK